MKRLGDDAVYVRIHKFPSLIIQFETVVYSTSSTEWLMPNGTTGGMSFIEFCIVASFAGRAWLDSPSACVLPTAAIPSLKCASTSAKSWGRLDYTTLSFDRTVNSAYYINWDFHFNHVGLSILLSTHSMCSSVDYWTCSCRHDVWTY